MAFRLLQTIATKLEISTAGTPTSKRRRASWDVNISNSQQLEGFCSEFGTKSLFFASDDEWNFWQQIPAQVDVAVRKVFHWERTDVMSTEEFRERVAKRTLHNFTTDARKKMAAGISFADWKAQIKNLEAWLTKVARRASIDEARKVLRLRATKEPQVVVAGFTGFIASVELQESWSRVASAVRELLPAHISDDAGEPMLQFLRGELQTRDRWEHFQVCEDCQLAGRVPFNSCCDVKLEPIVMSGASVTRSPGRQPQCTGLPKTIATHKQGPFAPQIPSVDDREC